ncbi:MAG: hypothetical protein KM312_09795, partial [Hydrogenibacillus schlegelii]|nr:hypothetical protein [Hydrogenibacillus schlegelii]
CHTVDTNGDFTPLDGTLPKLLVLLNPGSRNRKLQNPGGGMFMYYADKVLSNVNLILFYIIAIPILYYLGGPVLKAVFYLLLFGLYTIIYILDFLLHGPQELFLWREFIDDYIISSLWGDIVYAVQKIWELITSKL